MDYHVDDVLYSHPQIEVIFTLFNSSNCKTIYKNKSANGDDTLHEVETEPNSILLIPAGGAIHKVSPLKYGRRIIVKFVFNYEHCKLLSSYTKENVGQFGGKPKRR